MARPFVILAAGQSNMIGRDDGGSKAVQSGITMTNDLLSPTALVTAAFGVAPLNTTSAGGTSSVASACCNNQAVWFANRLRLSGKIPASRPIIIVWNAQGGQPISQWVPTTAPYWADLLSTLALVNASYPGFTIDHVIWDQLEGDAGSTFAAYAANFTTLLSQWRSLPQWTPTTTVSCTEAGPFYDNTQQQRNDFVRSMRGGLFDPYVTCVSASGLTESTENPPFHFDGNSLVTLGSRHFGAWDQARITGGYFDHGMLDAATGGAHVIPQQLTLSGTLTVSPDNLRGRGCYIDASAGGTIHLPPAVYMSECDIYVFVGATVTLSSAAAITFESATAATSGTLALQTGQSSGVWRIYCLPTKAQWCVESVFPRTGNSISTYLAMQAGAQTVTELGMRGAFVSLSQTVLTIPFNGADGSMAVFYAAGTANSSIYASGAAIYLPNGSSVTTYTVTPGALVIMIAMRGHWFIVYQSREASRFTQLDAPASGGTITSVSGIGDLTHIINPAGTIAALTVNLPSSPADGSKVGYIAEQAVTAVTFANGTVVGAPAGLTAGQKLVLTYSVVGSAKWY